MALTSKHNQAPLAASLALVTLLGTACTQKAPGETPAVASPDNTQVEFADSTMSYDYTYSGPRIPEDAALVLVAAEDGRSGFSYALGPLVVSASCTAPSLDVSIAGQSGTEASGSFVYFDFAPCQQEGGLTAEDETVVSSFVEGVVLPVVNG